MPCVPGVILTTLALKKHLVDNSSLDKTRVNSSYNSARPEIVINRFKNTKKNLTSLLEFVITEINGANFASIFF